MTGIRPSVPTAPPSSPNKTSAVPPVLPRSLPRAEAEWQQQYESVHRRFSFFAVLALLFIKFGVVQEIMAVTLGSSLFLLHIFTPPAVLGVFLSGGAQRAFAERAAWLWAAFAGWIALGVPFSSWVGGSASYWMYYIRDHWMMMLLAAGAIMTWKECRLVLGVIAVALPMDLVFVRFLGGDAAVSDRLQLGFSGTIANANDLAAHLLLLVCFMLFFLLRPGSPFSVRALAGGSIAIALFFIMKTGSRGALVATVLGSLIYLARATPRQRLIAVLMIPIVLTAVLLAIPAETLHRITSFSSTEGSIEAAMSKESREYLLRKSIEFTFKHPVFGVGMGQFSNYEGRTSREAGERGNWHETHNAYTQVSSETGIPALLFYLGAIVFTAGLLLSVSRRARAVNHGEIYIAATCLITALSTFCIAILFLSLAYRFYLPALSGIIIAFYAAAQREMKDMPIRLR